MSRTRSRHALMVAAALAVSLAVPVQASSQPPKLGPDDPEGLARTHLADNVADYGISAADIAEVITTDSYESRHTGVNHVYLRQTVDGIEIVDANMAVNLAADGTVLHTASRFYDDVAGRATGTADIDAVAAVAAGAAQLGLDPDDELVVVGRSVDGGTTMISDGGIADAQIPAKLVYQPLDSGEFRLAWQIEIDESDGDAVWVATVDAENGELLESDDQVDRHDIRDLAAALARPGTTAVSALGAQAITNSPSFTGVPDGSSYRVYPVPFDSPYDGDRELVSEPADPVGSPYGWHDTTATATPDFTRTRGNNVHAYTDTTNTNTPDPDSDPDGGATLTFDFPLDLTQQPSTYADAAVTNLFYWNNVVHDITYRYGFDEVSGNFQVNNYGKGGLGNDDVRAEAQDGGGINNANFLTPVDGSRPRMQMYLWNANAGGGLTNRVDVDPPSSAAGTYQMTDAAFGPAFTQAGLSGPMVVVNDGSALPSEGCGPLVGFPAGAIAIVDRGTCPFVDKVVNAQAAGAISVIVANNVAGAPITLGGAAATSIPAGMISLADANTIKAGLPATGRTYAGPPIILRDGDLDAGIIVHEYAHGISNRLTGGPGTNCLSGQQQMGEGWSDYYAVAYTNIAADKDQPRGVGTYALRQENRWSQGIRPTPYSTDKNINPTTYASIPALAVPHGVGYVWANTLWEMHWDLVDKHGFNPDVYGDWSTGGNNLAIQLVTDGLKFQGCTPGFLDGRDGILAAEQALTEGRNECTVWRAFARRGMGFSAVQGSSANRTGIVEAFDLPDQCRARQFRAELSGANEVGGGHPDGTGSARVDFDQTGKVCFDIRVQGIGAVTMAHIHVGGHGVNGPVVVDFNTPVNGLKNCVTVDPALLQTIRTTPSGYYVNVHTAAFPAGAVRGQLD